MKTLSYGMAVLMFCAAAGAQAASDPNNPYNSATRRANPNSMQGTTPVTPGQGVNRQVNPRPPTLQNGGIGNGNNLRRDLSKPDFDSQRPARPTDRTP
ncbi:MAG: hypothetical protein PW845_12855 [Pseudomonas sp.]|uniref:hypothetical protein n=1 Tax=Pseudomonas abieticivorans TaxID=2931382 RepID=UPI0020BE7DE6|nr:hypothetical protein [Pseudomonas sp. PIA16]MDE1166251.1 hypothetical protein [Pseudomonas sp.]